MEKILKLYNYVDGVNDTPFPNVDDQVIIGDFRSDYKRMGTAPTISCTVHHRLCLDDLWSYNVYASFNGEKFFIKQIPSSSFDNTDARYKHDLELVSERIILDNVYFYDVVSEEYEGDKPVSNSSNVVFFGDIHEFVQRLNYSLNYSKLNYSVVVDEGVSSESKLLSFQDQFFSNVLQEIYNIYEIPYYIVGNVIHIGYTDNTINHVFKYGVDESLLSIQKQNANQKIVNRITGVGSSDNVPYYYPNFDNKGVTEVLYNGETGKVNIVNETKYNKIKLNDVLSYNMSKEDDKSLLDNSFFTDINFTYTDYESQYGIEFYYKFTIKETCNIRLSLNTTYQDSEDIFCDLYDENKNYIGYFKDGDIAKNLAKGNYRIKVTWNLVSAEPMTRPLAEQLVIEHISVNATIVGTTNYWWSLNGKTINLSDYGISLSVAPSVGDEISVRQLSYIKPSANLMPSIYRETTAKERFYNAVNNSYTNPETDKYYTFNNPYIVGKPKEFIYNLEDIKPTIKGVTNAEGLRIDMFSAFAFDENDNDEFDAEGNYLHPYFFGKLRKFDGEYGFNLFDHAIDEDEMVISMTSGSCGACEFIIGVDDETQKNIVQVDENGNLLRDSNGNVIRSGSPQDKQNDTKNNEVWVALKKDQNTFGVLMPNASSNYRPQAGDTFVILHIDLPKSYILSAEKKLEQELIKYMSENNDEKFTFSLSFSRIFFAENPTILEQLNENSRIQIEYNGRQYLLYVSSYSCNVTKEQPLPEIRIELSDVLAIAQNSLNNTISELKNDVLSNITLTESQILLYTSNVKKDLNSKVDNTKQEINKTISDVETAMYEYTNDAKAVLHESIKSINEIKVNTNDVYTKQEIEDNFVTKNTKQEVSGEKNFIGGLKINNQEIVYDVEKNYWKLEGDLLVTGGVTMYGNDSDFVASTIMDAILYDDTTLGINAQGQLYVKGSVGGATTMGSLSNVGSWADSVASQDRIMYQAANSSQWVAKNLSDLAVGGVTGDYLPLSGGTISGTSTYPLVVNTTDAQSGIQFLSNNDLLGVIINGGDYGTALINFKGKYRALGIDNDGNAYTTIDYSNTKANLLHTYNYSSYALPLSGGTLTNTLTIDNSDVGLILHRSGQKTPYIRFGQDTNNEWGELGVYNDGRLVFWPLVSSQGGYGQWNTVWHSGNDGSGSGLDADLLDGYDSSYIMKYGGNWTASTDTAGIFAFGFGGSSAGLANNYGAGIQLCNAQGITAKPSSNNNSANWYSQLLFGTDNRVYARFNTNGGGWSGQNKIAYVTDNVASATKLHTARTIWGQSFDGTADITGDLKLGLSRILGVDGAFLITSSADSVTFGYGTSAKGIPTYIDGNTVYIRYGASRTTGLFVSGAGNVGIGTTSPAYKLDVFGSSGWTCHFNTNKSVVSMAHADAYGLFVGTTSTSSDIYALRVCASLTGTNPLFEVKANGNVGIGTTNPSQKLHVVGNILATGGITMYSARKLKNITDERGLSLDELSVIKPTRFTWKDGRDDKVHIGGIADDVMKVLPEVIYKTGEDDTLTMDYGNAAFAIASSLIKPVVNHEERIKMLEEENKRLKEEVEQLKWNIA